MSVDGLGDRGHHNLRLTIIELIGDWHHDLGLEASLDLAVTDDGDSTMSDLR